MARYRLMGGCGWIANSDIELGEDDFPNEEEAQDAAWEAVCERMDSWVVKVDASNGDKENRHTIGNRIKYEMQQAAKAAARDEGKE